MPDLLPITLITGIDDPLAAAVGRETVLTRIVLGSTSRSEARGATLCAMRLTAHERATILHVVNGFTEARGRVWLFGSRANDSARGGDLDLLVESAVPVPHPARLMAAIGARLEMELGERRIDVLLQAPNLKQLPVHRVAKSTGILLS